MRAESFMSLNKMVVLPDPPFPKNKGFYGGGIVLSELKLGRNSIHMAELSDLYGECLQKSDFSCAHHIESRGAFLLWTIDLILRISRLY